MKAVDKFIDDLSLEPRNEFRRSLRGEVDAVRRRHLRDVLVSVPDGRATFQHGRRSTPASPRDLAARRLPPDLCQPQPFRSAPLKSALEDSLPPSGSDSVCDIGLRKGKGEHGSSCPKSRALSVLSRRTVSAMGPSGLRAGVRVGLAVRPGFTVSGEGGRAPPTEHRSALCRVGFLQVPLAPGLGLGFPIILGGRVFQRLPGRSAGAGSPGSCSTGRRAILLGRGCSGMPWMISPPSTLEWRRIWIISSAGWSSTRRRHDDDAIDLRREVRRTLAPPDACFIVTCCEERSVQVLRAPDSTEGWKVVFSGRKWGTHPHVHRCLGSSSRTIRVQVT